MSCMYIITEVYTVYILLIIQAGALVIIMIKSISSFNTDQLQSFCHFDKCMSKGLY